MATDSDDLLAETTLSEASSNSSEASSNSSSEAPSDGQDIQTVNAFDSSDDGSDQPLMSTDEENPIPSLPNEDEYGGRGEPELQKTSFLQGDVVEFCYEGKIYTGAIDDAPKMI